MKKFKETAGDSIHDRSEDEDEDRCPDCDALLETRWSGVACPNCNYAFCF